MANDYLQKSDTVFYHRVFRVSTRTRDSICAVDLVRLRKRAPVTVIWYSAKMIRGETGSNERTFSLGIFALRKKTRKTTLLRIRSDAAPKPPLRRPFIGNGAWRPMEFMRIIS